MNLVCIMDIIKYWIIFYYWYLIKYKIYFYICLYVFDNSISDKWFLLYKYLWFIKICNLIFLIYCCVFCWCGVEGFVKKFFLVCCFLMFVVFCCCIIFCSVIICKWYEVNLLKLINVLLVIILNEFYFW